MSKKIFTSLMFLSVIYSVTASAAEAKPKSLFERLGGKRAIAAVIDDFVNVAAKDPKVNFTRDGKFKSMDVPFLKGQLTDFISAVTGGDVKYNGKDMKSAHAGMKIKSSEFDALAADLAGSLDKFKVPAKEKAELMALAASTKPAIVEVDDSKSLYDRLGGKRAIAAVVDHFVNLAAVDPKVNFTRDGKFKSMDVPFLKGQLTDFISSVTGGSVKYSGKDMKTAHAGMKIKSSEFDALAADLVAALDKFKVPENEKNELLKLVGSTKAIIVEVDDSKAMAPSAAAPMAKDSGVQGESMNTATLYKRLGGKDAITAVVTQFVANIANDKRVNKRFAKTNITHLTSQLIAFVSMATGGPKEYNGLDMKSAHEGMKIKTSEFNALADDLLMALKKFKVPQKEVDDLMKVVGSTKKDIVEVP